MTKIFVEEKLCANIKQTSADFKLNAYGANQKNQESEDCAVNHNKTASTE